MKFSIITPVFNGMPVLCRCIGSVRGQLISEVTEDPGTGGAKQILQSSAPPFLVEHLIQDGGSTDGTLDLFEKLCAGTASTALNTSLDQHEGRHASAYQLVSASETDDGMYDAINKGWKKADGDILSWLNSDEQYLPGTLEKVATFFKQNPEAEAVFGNMIIVDPEGRPLAARREVPFRSFYVKREFVYTASCTLFFRRTLLERGLLEFDTTYRLAGDMDLLLNLAANGVRIHQINDYLSLFGVDNENLTVKYKDLMSKEVHRIRRFYKGSNNPVVCKLVRILRYMERTLRGCYRKEDVSYLYAINELPEYISKCEKALSFRFTYALARKKMAADK